MKSIDDISGYKYGSGQQSCAHDYLMPAVEAALGGRPGSEKRVFDLGCGNGSVAARLSELGWAVTGVDPSSDGIEMAKKHHPQLDLHTGSAYDDLPAQYGQYPVVVSLEVVEHVYAPRDFAKTLHGLVEPGGVAIISTPYHGYIKNLAMAVTGKMDAHFTALWDHGHIKFWSIKTLAELLEEAGFTQIKFVRVGRLPALAKSMIAIATRPKNT